LRRIQEAIISGASARLRPILMTTLTTILGLIPLSLGLGQGSQLQAPMAVAVIGGMTSGTILLLGFIPALYYLINRRTA
jgi:HAE1 family hydrophobic/amphiphilic exporter-1